MPLLHGNEDHFGTSSKLQLDVQDRIQIDTQSEIEVLSGAAICFGHARLGIKDEIILRSIRRREDKRAQYGVLT